MGILKQVAMGVALASMAVGSAFADAHSEEQVTIRVQSVIPATARSTKPPALRFLSVNRHRRCPCINRLPCLNHRA
jgi:hypothetical protein